MKDPSTATSFIRHLGLIDFGRAIMGSIILVCVGLSWIMRGRIAQSWPMTVAARVTTTWILFPLTQNTWLIIENLMAISLITCWVLLGRVSTNSAHHLKRFIMAWIVVGPIIAAWLTTSWAETSRILLSCTRRSAPVLTLFALKALSGDMITIADLTDRMWTVPSSMSRGGHMALVTLTLGLVIWSDAALSWVLPGWITTSLAAISLIAIGWNELAINDSFGRAMGAWVLIGLITAAWVTTSWILLHLTHNLWLIPMSWIETSWAGTSKSY